MPSPHLTYLLSDLPEPGERKGDARPRAQGMVMCQGLPKQLACPEQIAARPRDQGKAIQPY